VYDLAKVRITKLGDTVSYQMSRHGLPFNCRQFINAGDDCSVDGVLENDIQLMVAQQSGVGLYLAFRAMTPEGP
jgi:hypothetical protein